MSKSNSSIIRSINEKGFCVCPTYGDSMKPFLRQGKTSVYIERVSGDEIKKYDIALYVRSDGVQVLHRVVGKDKSGFITCGDNRYAKERGVTPDMIAGRAKGYFKKDRYYSFKSPKMRAFALFWYFIFPIRGVWLRIKFRMLKNKQGEWI